MEWILVALISITGFVKGVNVEVIGEFESEVACLSAARDVRTALEVNIDQNIRALCLPTKLKLSNEEEATLLKKLKTPRKRQNFSPSH